MKATHTDNQRGDSSSSSFLQSSMLKVAACSAFGLFCYATYQSRHKRRRLCSEWKNKNIARIADVSRLQILELMEVALSMEHDVKRRGGSCLAEGKLLTTVFYEPSTRTRCSFEAAMKRLGGTVLSLSDMKRSSVSKGETLEDTMKCLSRYSDVLVVRHPEKGTPDRVIKAVPDIPVLNAGDGSGEHPTQALLDLFTIWKEREHSLDGLTITFVGDLRYGRTVHSLVPALTLFEGLYIQFVAPTALRIPSHIEDELRDKGIAFKVLENLSDDVLAATDVLYVTRIQKERFESLESYQKVKGCFVIDAEVMSKCRSDMIVMHPLPRVDEIAVEVDDDPRALYFQQMENGMYLRMALLALVLGVY